MDTDTEEHIDAPPHVPLSSPKRIRIDSSPHPQSQLPSHSQAHPHTQTITIDDEDYSEEKHKATDHPKASRHSSTSLVIDDSPEPGPDGMEVDEVTTRPTEHSLPKRHALTPTHATASQVDTQEPFAPSPLSSPISAAAPSPPPPPPSQAPPVSVHSAPSVKADAHVGLHLSLSPSVASIASPPRFPVTQVAQVAASFDTSAPMDDDVLPSPPRAHLPSREHSHSHSRTSSRTSVAVRLFGC